MIHHLSGSRLLRTVLLPVLAASGIAAGKPDLSKLSFYPVPLTQAIEVASPAALQQPLVNSTTLSALPDVSASVASKTPGSIERYQQALTDAQADQGAFDLSVSQLSLALGQALQAQGELPGALSAFNRSLQVLRVNLGLYSLEQVPVMKSIIQVLLQQQDLGHANDMQQALFNLQIRGHGRNQASAIPAFIEWADWNVNLYLLQDPRLPELIDGKFAQLNGRQLGDQRLGLAYVSYTAALDILRQQSSLSDERLVTTERKLAALNFMIDRKLHNTYGEVPASDGYYDPDWTGHRPEQAGSTYFVDGGSALRRAVAYSYSAPDPDKGNIATRLMELADWYLLFDHRADALDIYQDALEVMEAASLPREEVERIMSPGMPVRIPDETYLVPERHHGNYAGYIDVQFDLSRFGHAIKPRIIGSSAAERAIEKELLRTIRSCKFRPKFLDGSAVNHERVQLRYYYSL